MFFFSQKFEKANEVFININHEAQLSMKTNYQNSSKKETRHDENLHGYAW